MNRLHGATPPRAAGALGGPLDTLPDFSSSLPQSLAEYREKYHAWRTGRSRGAKGEPGANGEAEPLGHCYEPPRVVRRQSAPGGDDPSGVRRRRTADAAWSPACGASEAEAEAEAEARRAAQSAAVNSIELEKARSRFVASMQAPRP